MRENRKGRLVAFYLSSDSLRNLEIGPLSGRNLRIDTASIRKQGTRKSSLRLTTELLEANWLSTTGPEEMKRAFMDLGGPWGIK